jgi:enoyl-CoA hydratase/carnithine racemase
MSSLLVQEFDGVGHIALNRVGALNALSREFCLEIDGALRRLDNSNAIRAILITSALKHFCAGADIPEMAEIRTEEAIVTNFGGCVEHLPSVSKPVIVAVNGLAAGGGCELVEMCDIVIAAASATFCHPEITLAAMPGAGGTQRLSRVVGKHIAMDLLLTGRALSAEEALAAGLVSRVVADDQLVSTALSVARQVASFSSPVARRIKACINASQVQLADGLQNERENFHRCFAEHDFHEGLNAFVGKRKAHFLHR